MNNKKAVLITTQHRGVFFGYVEDTQDLEATNIWISDARNCIYWDKNVKGFWGLASVGPNDQCRVGPAVQKALIRDVTSVAECSADAAASWEKAPW